MAALLRSRVGAVLPVLILVAAAGRPALAQATSVKVSGSPLPLAVTTAAAGSLPAPDVDNSSTYTIKNSGANPLKMTAQLSAAMPAGVTLTASFSANNGATALGAVALDASARDVVSALAAGKNVSGTITYTLSATPAAGVVPPQTRTVTLTLVNAP